MRVIFAFFIIFFTQQSSAGSTCSLNKYLNSADGKEKLEYLVERSRGLIISKLEALGIDENQLDFKVHLPRKYKDPESKLEIKIKSKSLTTVGAGILIKKELKEGECGIEVILQGGHLLNHESGKDFGSLGTVKEWVRIE